LLYKYIMDLEEKPIKQLSLKKSNKRVEQLKKKGYEIFELSTPNGIIVMKRKRKKIKKY